eukprot:358937-Chlamydomonas_euryale.AAC.11
MNHQAYAFPQQPPLLAEMFWSRANAALSGCCGLEGRMVAAHFGHHLLWWQQGEHITHSLVMRVVVGSPTGQPFQTLSLKNRLQGLVKLASGMKAEG